MTSNFEAAQDVLLKAAHSDDSAEASFWRQCDANNGGTITISELQQWLSRHFPVFNNKQPLQQAFKLAALGDPSKLAEVHERSNPKPQTPNSKPQTPNPKPQTPNPKP